MTQKSSSKSESQKAYQMLTVRLPEEWLEQVEQLRISFSAEEVDAFIQNAVRERVACIVWWDFFGHRPSPQRWPHLDKWLHAPYSPVPDELVERGLVEAGYPADRAHARVRDKIIKPKIKP